MKFTGVGVALVTPFNSDNSIDYLSLEQLINKVIDGGVDFLVALGTTAETPTLTSNEKKEVLEYIIKINAGRIPVIAGIGGNSTQAVIETIALYKDIQIDGILSVVPYYNKPSQEGIFQHFSAIATSTLLPIILYNVPGRTVTNMLPETTIRLANEFKNIVAIKEASGSIPQCMELVQKAPSDFTILSGDDNLSLAQISIGMKGVISVAANAFPETFSQMVHAAINNEMEKARQLHYQILTPTDLLFVEGNPTGVKYILSQQQIIANYLRLPLIPASSTLSKALDAYISIR